MGLALGLVLGCTPRGEIVLYPQVSQNDTSVSLQQIFIATTRQKEGAHEFNALRTSQVSLARYDISVPPTHTLGRVEWPQDDTPDPSQHFLTRDIQTYETRGDFRTAVRSSISTEDAVVFVHGYNNTFAEGLYRFAQIAQDVNITGQKFHYAWPSSGDARGYIHDRDSVLFARDGFEQFLDDIAAANPNGVYLVAHSIGSALTMETLRQASIKGNTKLLSAIRGVIFISPDIDVNVFLMQMRRITPAPEQFLIFASQRDIALRLSSFITGSGKRLGLIDNPEKLRNVNVDLIDITSFTDSTDILNHSVAATSPTLLAILSNPDHMRDLLDTQKTARRGSNVVSRIVQTANDATQIILNP
ncbi:hypothetical protein GCM10007939_11930 [Amylibacter marinus]|uniref:Esterase/lipase superfamily enzyme n=2 Tax=Amylibacter marinus TaxID=1475483 RepID=A0ABQ5VTZ8_9RHOB|nr:hypothetical protein GCM10007939_11930 [Amylibacter marinus]